jgi:hypothetical protein
MRVERARLRIATTVRRGDRIARTMEVGYRPIPVPELV